MPFSDMAQGRAAQAVPPQGIMRNLPNPHKKRDDRGAVAIEFVLVAPFLLALVFAIAQFGLYFSKSVDVASTARDAARTLALRGTPTYPAGMTSSGVVTCAAGDTTSNSSVTVSSSYTFSIPFIPLGTKTVTATGTMRCGG
jgi:Flp pilus assembly protein TadG